MDKNMMEMFRQIIREELEGVKTELSGVKSQVSENTQILKSLEHSVSVMRAKQDSMEMDIATMKGDIKSIKRDMNRVEEATANNWVDITKLKKETFKDEN